MTDAIHDVRTSQFGRMPRPGQDFGYLAQEVRNQPPRYPDDPTKSTRYSRGGGNGRSGTIMNTARLRRAGWLIRALAFGFLALMLSAAGTRSGRAGRGGHHARHDHRDRQCEPHGLRPVRHPDGHRRAEHTGRTDTFSGNVTVFNGTTVEPGKRVVLIGLAGSPSTVDTRTITLRELTVQGLLGAGDAIPGTIDLFASGRVDARRLVAATLPLERVADVLAGNRPPGSGPGPKVHFDPSAHGIQRS